MKLTTIPCFFLPSKIIAVDDNPAFLKSLRLILQNPSNYTVFHKPFDALTFLNKNYEASTQHNSIKTFDQDLDSTAINIELKQIHQQIYNPNRFDEIAVIITDYSMPGIDGIQFCQQIENKKIKRVLLTGEASLELAVKAFNQHLIDQFIVKTNFDWAVQLNLSILEARSAYYLSISEQLIDSHSITALTDPAFIQLFEKLCNDYAIVEFYLLDNQGSFLLLDKDAKPVWLLVKDDDAMEGAAEFAELADAPINITNVLTQKTHVPFFYSETDFATAPSDWERYLHPAKMLPGNKRYYYSVLLEPSCYPLNTANIISFQHYLKNKTS